MNHLNMVSDKKLTQTAAGDRVVVLKLFGGERFKERLLSMGILPGKDIEVMAILRHGPVIVRVNDTRVVIGHNMAEKIFVK